MGACYCGIIQGLKRAGWNVPIITTELSGTASLHASMKAFDVISVSHPTQLNTYLMGTSTIAQHALDSALTHKVLSVKVDESEAILACCRFADDHHMGCRTYYGSGPIIDLCKRGCTCQVRKRLSHRMRLQQHHQQAIGAYEAARGRCQMGLSEDPLVTLLTNERG